MRKNSSRFDDFMPHGQYVSDLDDIMTISKRKGGILPEKPMDMRTKQGRQQNENLHRRG
jgi:hypothetical protein